MRMPVVVVMLHLRQRKYSGQSNIYFAQEHDLMDSSKTIVNIKSNDIVVRDMWYVILLLLSRMYYNDSKFIIIVGEIDNSSGGPLNV